ncbi:MAG: hypothetical protein RQM92_09375 [Candidatus Syntrophopropionicum ammoniitolerans]
MPRKQVYIKDEDVGMFERAEELFGDSFSAMIAEAVRRLVDQKESKETGMEEQVIGSGVYYPRGDDDVKLYKFIGKQIADARIYSGQTKSRDDQGIDYTLYLTKKEKYLVHIYQWTRWENENCYAEYRVFDTLEELQATKEIPGSLLKGAGDIGSGYCRVS